MSNRHLLGTAKALLRERKEKKKIRGLPGRTEVLNKGGFHSWKTPQGPEVNGGIELLA